MTLQHERKVPQEVLSKIMKCPYEIDEITHYRLLNCYEISININSA